MKLDQRIVCRQLPPRCDMGSGEADVPVPSANTGSVTAKLKCEQCEDDDIFKMSESESVLFPCGR